MKERGGPVTSQACECFRQTLQKEEKISRPRLQAAIAKVGDINRPNNYLGYYKKEGTGHQELSFTIDKIQDETPYDPKTHRDTCHPQHARSHAGFQSSRPLRSSQIYGWYQPIDQPKFGFERTRICQDSFIDKSHLHLSPPQL